MPFLNWAPKMSVGIESIDEQHKKLIGQINSVVDIMLMQADSNADLNDVMDALVDYTRTHFAFEESLFAEHQYTETSDHISHHEHLRNGLMSHIDKFRRGQLDKARFLEFLKDWLINHIMETDMKYSEFLRDRGGV